MDVWFKRPVNACFIIDDIAEDTPGEPENDNKIVTKVSKDTENNENPRRFYENKPQKSFLLVPDNCSWRIMLKLFSFLLSNWTVATLEPKIAGGADNCRWTW